MIVGRIAATKSDIHTYIHDTYIHTYMHVSYTPTKTTDF